MLEGEIYNLAELKRRVQADGTTCGTLLALYLDMGPDRLVEQLDGEFNIVVHEPDRRTLTILNDHLGSYPIYFWQQSGTFLFGSEKKAIFALVEEEREVDPVGLLQGFMHDHSLGDRTYIRTLKRLPAASRLTVVDGRLSISSCGGLQVRERATGGASGLLDEWEDKLRAATEKRLKGKSRLLFSLSAGLDSRAVACSIPREKRPIWARTRGTNDSLEVIYAKRIAEKLDFGHFTENPSDFAYSDAVHKVVWRTEGELHFRHTISIFTHQQMKLYGDHFIGGWLGDVSSGGHLRPFMFLTAHRQRYLDTAFRRYVLRTREELRSIFTDSFLDKYLDAVRDEFYQSHKPFEHLPVPRAYEFWDLCNRQPRMIVASMPVDSYLFGKVRPFFDRSYLEFAMSLPMRWRVGQNLYKAMINRIGPELRSIPNGNTNGRIYASPSANLAAFVKTSSMLMARKAGRRMRSGHPRWYEQVKPREWASGSSPDRPLEEIVRKFVESPFFDDAVFNRSGISQLLRGGLAGPSGPSPLACSLITFSVALPYFVYGRVARCPEEAEPLGAPRDSNGE